MAEVKLIAKHGDFTIEVKDSNPDKVVVAYQELLMKLEAIKSEG